MVQLKVTPQENAPSGHTNPRSIPPITSGLKVVNSLSVSRTTGCIEDVYVVDPTLVIPNELLPEGGSYGPNLSLESQKSFLKASVFVLPVTADGHTAPGGKSGTHLVFSARDRVDVLLRHLGNIPCTIEATSVKDSVQVEIPRGFVGLVTTDSARPPRMPARKCVPLSEAGGKRRYFVGPRPPSETWQGTELHIEAPRGSIDVHFVGERPAISFSTVFTVALLLLWFTYHCDDQCSLFMCWKASSLQCAGQFLWSGRLKLLLVSAVVYRFG